MIRGAPLAIPLGAPCLLLSSPTSAPEGHQRASLGVRNQSCLGAGGLAWGGAPLVCRWGRSLLYSLCAHVALPVPLQPLPPCTHTHLHHHGPGTVGDPVKRTELRRWIRAQVRSPEHKLTIQIGISIRVGEAERRHEISWRGIRNSRLNSRQRAHNVEKTW